MRNLECGIRNFGRADSLLCRTPFMPDRIYNDIIINISQIMYNYKQTAKITDGKPPVTDCFYDFDYLRLF